MIRPSDPFPIRSAVASALLLATTAVTGPAAANAQELQLADLGECRLESGEVIRDCVIGYRTIGELNADRSNVVLFPAWGFGTSEAMLAYVGPNGFVDPAVHYVIALDQFANGVAISPSNSPSQPGDAFPDFTIGDMVRAQHRLLTEVLGIDRLHAVVGISLSAFQAFQWVTAFPGFVDRAVPVVGSPRPTPSDQLVFAFIDDILSDCEPDCDRAKERFLQFFRIMVRTPEHYDRTLSPEDIDGYFDGLPAAARGLPDIADLRAQLNRIRSDVASEFGGSLERAAEAVRAHMLIVIATHDRLVAAAPAREFARLTGARLHESDGDCGHHIFICERAELGRVIRAFLAEPMAARAGAAAGQVGGSRVVR